MDRDKNSKKRHIFMKKAKAFFNKKTKEKEDCLGRQLTKEERRETRKKNRKKARLVATIAASSILGAFVGSETRHLLDSGHTIEVVDKKEHSVEIDDKEVDGVIRITNARHSFINGIQIDKDELEVVKNMNGNLEMNTRREVEMLQNNPKRVETYIKTLLVNEYNEKKGKRSIDLPEIVYDLETEDITNDDITSIHRKKGGRPQEENKRSNSFLKEMAEGRIDRLSVTIMNKEDNKEQTILLPYMRTARNDYQRNPMGYRLGRRREEYVKMQEVLENLLPVIDKGLDWIDEEARDGGSKQTFFESILKYKKDKMNEITTKRMVIDDNENTEEQGSFINSEFIKDEDER